MTENGNAPQTLEQRRQTVVELLSDAYAQSTLDDDEFERRVEEAENATSREQLDRLLHGVVPEHTAAPAPVQRREAALVRASNPLVPSTQVPRKRTLLAVFGANSRAGDWTVPRCLRVMAVFGGSELDFRQASLAPGTTEIHVTAVLGGVEIIVPPGLPVDVDGVGILGGFEEVGRKTAGDPGAPARLRITGTAVLGGVEIEERLPGETASEARKRRRSD